MATSTPLWVEKAFSNSRTARRKDIHLPKWIFPDRTVSRRSCISAVSRGTVNDSIFSVIPYHSYRERWGKWVHCSHVERTSASCRCWSLPRTTAVFFRIILLIWASVFWKRETERGGVLESLCIVFFMIHTRDLKRFRDANAQEYLERMRGYSLPHRALWKILVILGFSAHHLSYYYPDTHIRETVVDVWTL